ALDVDVRRVTVNNDLGEYGVASGGHLATQVYLKSPIIGRRRAADRDDAALCIHDGITAFRRRPPTNLGGDGGQRFTHDTVAALEFHDRLDVGGEPQAIVLPFDAGDKAPARHGVGVERAHAQRIAEVAKHIE